MADDGFAALRLHSDAEFQSWLARDVEARDELYELIGHELGIGPASLDELEAFLLNRYPGPDDALRLDQRPVTDAAARHTGLVLVLGINGATWDIDLTDTDDAYYRLPVVRLPDGSAECPLSLVTAALDRRTGDYLSGVTGYLIEQHDTAD
ncbi:hypothetical protein GA0070624_5126 [Micromonospora rhizosphaerae]|uniref:DUF3806 domain-containing protein n=1 Tax=Micromonospora rhizosphaerae TaxID=568872 RepID=A0A1C6SZJ7_9ACTN|nr:hypothetical protein [Micromonospora rhizosphaerae]SCL34948.1 hypothetical protein GA0070624_5126 [Micromonospora rhizosphaerae]